MSTKSVRLREQIAAPELLVMPGVYNGHSMRLVEQQGFGAAFITGGGVAESVLGFPDIGLMDLEENLFVTRRLASMSKIPLIGDGDTGYGNAVGVAHTVRSFEQAGVAGVMIEDQVWPKRCGHLAGKKVISAAEMVGKVAAAVNARQDDSFVIKARTDTLATHDIDEAIRRLNLYADAGADLLLADAVGSVEDMERLCNEVHGPICINMGFGIRSRKSTPMLTPRDMQDLGAAAAIYPRFCTTAAIQGMVNGMEAFKAQIETGIAVDRSDLCISFEDLHELMHMAEIDDLESRFVIVPDPA